MNKALSSWLSRLDTDFFALALMVGVISGLIEGASHMALQAFDIIGGVWYPIVWIAPIVDALVVASLSLLLIAGLSFVHDRSRTRPILTFLLVFAACLPWLALLHERINRYSLVLLAAGLAGAFTRWFGRREAAVLAFCRKGVTGVVLFCALLFGVIEGGSWLEERIATGSLPPAVSSSPNVLLIIVDALRSDHLTSYGYNRPSSPNLDRLATEGVLFEHAFSTSSYTLPSHASILTGLYPYEHGVEWLTSKVQEGAAYPTLPETLQTAGYRTAAFSGNTFWFTRDHGFGRGFLHFEDYFSSITDMVLRTAYGGIVNRIVLRPLGYRDIPARKRATDTNRAVLHWIDGFAGKPFFVTINYMDVHDPYLPPQPYRSKFSTAKNPGGLLNWQFRVPDALTPEQLQSEVDAYDGSIAYVDDQINKLVTAVQQRDSGRDLLVVITSDHGEQFNEHGGFLHGGQLNRELIQVPLIVWRPGRIPQGVRVDRPVSNAAIPATILNLVGVQEDKFAGPPLNRMWGGSDAHEWPLPLAELKQRDWEPKRLAVHYGSLRSVVSPTYQYIENDGLGPELYDWPHDLAEKNNLAQKPEMKIVIDQFHSQLRQNSFSERFGQSESDSAQQLGH